MQLQVWDDLAERLLDQFGDLVARRGSPEWVLAYPAVEGGWTLESAGAAAGTVGWNAPADCAALAMVGTAKVHAAPGPQPVPAGIRPGVTRGARLCCVVGRDGNLGWKMVIPGAESPGQPPEEGRMLDCMLRSLGLPTAPPRYSARPLWSLIWLQAILARGPSRAGSRITWTQAVALHPLASWAEAAIEAGRLEDTILAGGVDMSWERLRLATIADDGADGLVPAREAAWMDEGMFSRWVLGAITPPEELLAHARPLLTGPAARKMGHALRAATAPHDRQAAS